MPLPRLGGRIAQFVTWRFHFKAIGDARPIRRIEANAIVRLTRKSGDQAVPVMPGRSVEAAGEQLKFPPRPFQSRVNNPGAIAVQVEKPPRQKHQRENIDRQNPTRQGEPSRPSQGTEDHTDELQPLMPNMYAILCLKKKKHTTSQPQ